jgi:hypothetical protein
VNDAFDGRHDAERQTSVFAAARVACSWRFLQALPRPRDVAQGQRCLVGG